VQFTPFSSHQYISRRSYFEVSLFRSRKEQTYDEPDYSDSDSSSDYKLYSLIRAAKAKFFVDTRRGSEERNAHLIRLAYKRFIHGVMLVEKVVR